MKSPTRNTFIPLVIVLFGMLLLSCSSEEENSSEQVDASAEAASDRGAEANEEEKEPVTVQVQVHWEEQMFNERFKNPVEEHFPHITLEQIQSGSGRDSLEELFATGQSPDIFFEVSQRDLEYFELEYDLDEMVDKHNYDLSHINPVFLDALRARDFEEQRLLGMPYEAIYHVLFYNKEIFDLFGEDYPTAGMTWDDALELARSVSGERDGVEYRGLDLSNTSIPLLQLSVNKTDPETGEVMLDQPELSMYLELIDNIINLPGYGDENYFGASRFHEEQTTAMLLNFVQGIEWWSEAEENEGLNMDVTAMPVFSDRDPVTHLPNIIPLSINPHSEVKDAAFDVITFFTEDEYQVFASRMGLGPVNKNEEILHEFFQDYESTHNKDIPSIFTNPTAPPPEQISPWDSYVELNMGDYAESGLDRNEYLRIAAEEGEIAIQEAKAIE